ncbi:MAG: HEAT repeat domain-containing protein [Acidobacteria bacterium]|nr:HEAT repeat domain-containing protein [Acidobacteriota bacterium]
MKKQTRRPGHLRTAALLCALAALCAPARGSAQTPQTFWIDGYELRVSLHPVRAGFVLGEPVTLSLDVENRSDTDLELLLSGERGPGRADDFEVTVTGPDGRVLPRPSPEEGGAEVSYDNSYVSAARDGYMMSDGSMHFIVTLSNWAKVEGPGQYTVTYRRGVRAGPRARRYRIFPGTTRAAVEVSVQTTFEVVEGGPEALAQLIEQLGNQMLKCDRDSSVNAATRLAAMTDERVLKYVVGAVQSCKNPSVRYQALNALSNFKSDEAFEGLRLAAADADEDFRTVAANQLGGSKHPKALKLLFSMRRDPYYGVRLMVLQVLEGTDTAEARKLIWEMTQDEHPLVRDEALRFLQERATHPPQKEK